MFYLTMHSTHFTYGYMASDIWLRTILIVRKETRCRHIGYSYRLTARVLLYASSHRQDNTYHSLCYTSRGALAGARNSSMGVQSTKPNLESFGDVCCVLIRQVLDSLQQEVVSCLGTHPCNRTTNILNGTFYNKIFTNK